MNHSTVSIGVLAVLGVLAVGLLAGSIQSPTVLDDGGGSGFALGDGDGSLPFPSFTGGDAGAASQLPGVVQVILVLAAIAVILGVLYTFSEPRMLLAAVLILGLALVVALLANFAGFESGSGANPLDSTGEAGQPGAPEDSPSPVSLLWAIAPLVGLLVVAAGFVTLSGAREGETDEETIPGEEGAPEGDDAAALAQIAGETAERIEAAERTNTSLENEVYRAWHEMTDQLQVANPESTTPGEFATAATKTGLDADAVAELTDLFEAVRYGGVEATEAREQRAVKVLQRVERSGMEAAEAEE